MSTPLNEEALEAGAKAMYYEEPWMKNTYSTESHKWEELQEGDRQVFREEAKTSVTAYLSALPAPAVVETVEQLDALPKGSVILEIDDRGAVLERVHSSWLLTGSRMSWSSQKATSFLPATVLYRPKETT